MTVLTYFCVNILKTDGIKGGQIPLWYHNWSVNALLRSLTEPVGSSTQYRSGEVSWYVSKKVKFVLFNDATGTH